MQGHGHMEDLLRNRRRRRNWRRIGRIGLVVVLLAAGVYLWFGHVDTGPSEHKERSRALARGEAVVHESIEAARRPLEVEADPEKTTEQRAREATWSEGKAVKLRGTLEEQTSVYRALEARGVPTEEIQPVISATEEKFDFAKSRPDDEWMAEVDRSGAVTRFRYKTSPVDIWETVRNSNGEYTATKIDVPVERREVALAGRVDGSLWEAISNVAQKGKLVYKFADIFAYSVDFNRETRPGDTFAMIVEKLYLKGRFLRYGKVLAAEYVNKGEQFRGFLYRPENEKGGGYYNAEGKNLKRQFLKSPLASIRVTSRYGMRYHPVEGRRKMHRGVDYGAPVGTEIRAVADGTVEYAGYKGPNGNLIVLDHPNGYATLYAHLHEIADGIHPGAKVSRKTVIGEVGSTGRSTGPHLHFGMKRNGQYVDPMEVEFARGEPLKGAKLKRFKRETVDPKTKRLRAAKQKSDAIELESKQVAADEG